ncbi:MAG TPA: hypothetical protein VGR47_11595 [Terracidiphilus sp.]|nr:hypothetical protein [Terracidiphilus sp.]
MSPAPKAKRNAAAEEPVKDKEIRDNFAALYAKSVERMAEIQKHSIDLATQQNKETIGLWKQMTEKLPWAPPVNGFEEAETTLERFAGTQKTAIDLLVEQTHAFVEIMKERTAAADKTTDSVLKFAKQSFDRSMDAQKKAADAAVNETKTAFENARDRFEFPGGSAVAETIQHGVDAMVEAQKELLEAVSR